MLGAFVWPNVIHHTNEFAAARGIQLALLAGLGLTAALGLRYPLQMLPILLFELTWKAIYLIAFGQLQRQQEAAAAISDLRRQSPVFLDLTLVREDFQKWFADTE